MSTLADPLPPIAVIGAGWAGLASALSLAESGFPVTLFESAPVAGGRARTTTLDTSLGRFALDNGQHLIVGAYRETLALIERLGAATHLRRDPLQLGSPSGLSLRAAPLPAPLHLVWALVRAGGLTIAERLAVLRLMKGLQGERWRARDGETVTTLLTRWRQPARLVERLWTPLCVGAMNTLPAAACARSFAAVLRDTLGAERNASDFVTADAPLGSLLPEPALARLRALGATVRLRETVRGLRRSAPHGPRGLRHWEIIVGAGAPRFAAVLLALPPWSALRLVAPLGLDVAALRAFEAEPIATAWAFWPADRAPALPRWSLLEEDPSRGHHGQWLFDRGVISPSARAAPLGSRDAASVSAYQAHAALTGYQPSRIAGIVISVASRLDAVGSPALADGVAAQLREAFGGPAPAAVRVVVERRATFRCTPQRPRLQPSQLLGQAPGLWLAGDWLWPDYPATLEAAVRSGLQAAAEIVADMASGPASQRFASR